jgi:hypothetical protein
MNFPARAIDEGRLEWIDPSLLPQLSIPKTDREVIWPLVRDYSHHFPADAARPRDDSIFCVHIDCSDGDNFIVTHEHPPPSAASHSSPSRD